MISMKETVLNPRKRPKRPPREETNSTGPIEIPLSSSFEKKIFYLKKSISPVTVSCPKKMLRVAISSFHAL